MSTFEYAGATRLGGTSLPAQKADARAARRSGRWRTVWRIHFYAGMLAMPVLVLFALSGLVILYTQPIQNTFYGHIYTVQSLGSAHSLAEQEAAVERAYPNLSVAYVIPPRDARHSTEFGLQDAHGNAQTADVFVDPYTAKVLGSSDSGIVALANRFHYYLNHDHLKVRLPSLQGIFGNGPVMQSYPLGGLLMEVFAVWGFVLAATGLFLWWPRKRDTGKAMFVPRFAKKGRARWRDVHAVSGIILAALLMFFVTSGMPWSYYWGTNYGYATSKLDPARTVDQPNSSLARAGDVDRLGHRISWAERGAPVPTSGATAEPAGTGLSHANQAARSEDTNRRSARGSSAAQPARISLDAVASIAHDEHLRPGYWIYLPTDTTAAGTTAYGSYMLTNAWPNRLSRERTVYLDQFSGRTLARDGQFNYSAAGNITEFGVLTHMGTQFGLASRIVMTLTCVLVFISAATALLMWWKRRPAGKAGIPRRPGDSRLPWIVVAAAALLALVYPLWGATALIVVLVDKFVIRKVGPLRRAFGTRDAARAVGESVTG